MEAICQPGYYVRRRAWAVFPKSDANIRHWSRHKQSMAMAAGEDDADKFKSGGVLTCSASVQDSGEDRLTNTCGAYDVNHLKCVHGGVRAAAAELKTKRSGCAAL